MKSAMRQSGKGESNRKFPRTSADVSCAISRTGTGDPTNRNLRGRVKSLGLGGLAIETPIPLSPGEPLQVIFMVDEQRIEALARVVFAREAPGGLYEIGVQFTRIHEEYRDYLLASMLLKEYRIFE